MAIDRSKVSKAAESFLASGKFDRALEEFNRLLEDKPDDCNMMNRIGDIFLQANRMPEAVEMFRKAAGGFERGGFNSKATAVLKKAHRTVPEDVDVAARLADLYRQTNMIKDAIQIHIGVAELFTKKGLIKRALEEFAQVVELDPKNLKNKVKLADLYTKEGLQEKAASIYLEVAEALALDQLHGEATQVLERARSLINTPHLFLTHSRLCIIQKDLDGAVEVLRQGLDANPRSTEILEALAEVELQAHRADRSMEALAQVPQMSDRTLGLCERAMKELAKAGRAQSALALFRPIGREFARRGNGEIAAQTLQTGLQGHLDVDSWLLLSDFHHQSGNRTEQGEALRQALALAHQQGDANLVSQLSEQLIALGVEPGTFRTMAIAAPVLQPHPEDHGVLETTEVDPVKRMQIEQLAREAESFVRNRFMDRAQDAYQRILDLDPINRDAINRIAEIIKASGRMTAVQTHFVRTAERIAPMGHRALAIECLDRAEALFPGSTRLYRRTLNLLDATPVAAQGTLPSAPASAMPPRQAAIPMGAPVEPQDYTSLPVIPLDLSQEAPQATPPGLSGRDGLEEVLDLGGHLPMPTWESPEALTPPSFQDLDSLPTAESTFFLPTTEPLEALPVPTFEPTPWESQPQIDFLASEGALDPVPFEPLASPAEALGALPILPMESALPEALPTETPNLADFQASDLPRGVEFLHLENLPPLELEPLPFLPPDVVPPPASTTQAPVAPAAPTPFAPTALAPQDSHDIPEELSHLLPDIDFQLDYGSPEEAKLAIQEALAQFPDHPELTSRLQTAETALHRLGHQVEASPLSEQDFTGSFFDLTDVLGDSLMDSGEGEEMHDATRVVEKVQSVEELFDAFREGVEQQVRGDDYDTHYNLGIAYKEMMLIAPAMDEFKKAMADPERTLECCSMLSICEQSQGNLAEAERWLRQGIGTPGFPPEDSIGLCYDLGEILTLAGRPDEAREWYYKVLELDPDYREIAQRI